jgi:hypothetical protein
MNGLLQQFGRAALVTPRRKISSWSGRMSVRWSTQNVADE